MSFSTQNDLDRNAGATDAEETLRLIASLPAPEGIEDRVKSGVRAAYRQARVMSWPDASQNKAGWTQVSAMRAAAAAAIVLVVAGGGWEVYSHIRLAAAPDRRRGTAAHRGGRRSSAAAARRTPKTLDGPVIAVPANVKPRTPEGKADVLPQGHIARPLAVKSKSSQPVQR